MLWVKGRCDSLGERTLKDQGDRKGQDDGHTGAPFFKCSLPSLCSRKLWADTGTRRTGSAAGKNPSRPFPNS